MNEQTGPSKSGPFYFRRHRDFRVLPGSDVIDVPELAVVHDHDHDHVHVLRT